MKIDNTLVKAIREIKDLGTMQEFMLIVMEMIDVCEDCGDAQPIIADNPYGDMLCIECLHERQESNQEVQSVEEDYYKSLI